MLNLWVIAFLIVLLFGIGIAPRGSCFNDYLSSTYTRGLRGALAVAVVLCHLVGQTEGGRFFTLAFRYVGPLCVGVFSSFPATAVCCSIMIKAART